MTSTMYPNNIYIQNYDELKSITKPNGDKADMGVQFDIFDQRHGLEHNDLLRAVQALARYGNGRTGFAERAGREAARPVRR